MSKIRTWFENFVMHEKLTDPEWKILRGRFTNKELQSLDKKQFKRELNIYNLTK
jgi:hypothetical protein